MSALGISSSNIDTLTWSVSSFFFQWGVSLCNCEAGIGSIGEIVAKATQLKPNFMFCEPLPF